MTTIAANRKSMAADSRVTADYTPLYNTDKAFRIRDSLVGVAGSVQHTTHWLEWFRREMPPVDELMDVDDENDFAALVLDAKGLWLYTNTCEPDHLHDKYYAIGSGAFVAVRSMAAGDSPAVAVRWASKFDHQTGGMIKELHLLPPNREKAKRTRAGKTPKITTTAVPTEDKNGERTPKQS